MASRSSQFEVLVEENEQEVSSSTTDEWISVSNSRRKPKSDSSLKTLKETSPTIRKQLPKSLYDPLAQRARESCNSKYFTGDVPLRGRVTADMPLYIQKSTMANEYMEKGLPKSYIKGVTRWVQHWQAKNQIALVEEKIISYAHYLLANEPDLKEAAALLLKLLASLVPERKYKETTCHFMGESFTVWLPMCGRPVRDLLPFFHEEWKSFNPTKEPTSFERLTVFLDIYYEEGEEEERADALIINDYSSSDDLITLIQRKEDSIKKNQQQQQVGKKKTQKKANMKMQFIMQKQFPLERQVYFATDYKQCINILAKKAAAENWGKDQWILRNHVDQTVRHQIERNNLVPENNKEGFFLCHLNLIDPFSEPIFMRVRKFPPPLCNNPPMYEFCEWVFAHDVEGEILQLENEMRPKWFEDLNDMTFDSTLGVNINQTHIFDTNKNRIVKCLSGSRRMSERDMQEWLSSQLNLQLKAARYNHRLCIPQYYNGKVQLLLPLYYEKQVALVATLSKEEGKDGREEYVISTVLEPCWAYNNARLLSSIESHWLLSTLENTSTSSNIIHNLSSSRYFNPRDRGERFSDSASISSQESDN